MVTFRNNNNRRNSFRRNDRSYKSNNDRKYGSSFSNNDSFQRKAPGRNNHNASKLIEKYNDLAREALAHEDKILSENYYQHADHFTRVQNEQQSNRLAKTNASSGEAVVPVKNLEKKDSEKEILEPIEKQTVTS